MTNCFLFEQYLDDEQCLCLCLDDKANVEAPLLLRPLHEIRALQVNAKTIVVLSAEHCSLQEVELPWLSESKARAAIPYALEDQVAQNVATLHCAFDRQHYRDHRYLVAVIDKQFLLDLMHRIDRLELDFDAITLDWFALNEHEICITDRGLLVDNHLFKGALSGEIGENYLKSTEDKSAVYLFNDSFPALKNSSFHSLDDFSSVWIAKRLLINNPMNLCQGELQHGNRQASTRRWYHLAALLSAILVISIISVNAFYLHVLNAKIAVLDDKIAVIYHQFFPAAQQVISPKFRISQLLKMGFTRSESNTLWSLLDKLARPYQEGQFTLEQFRFQNQVLTITLVSKNFAELEKLQGALQQAQVKVTQLDASTHEQQVVATIELSLGASR